MAIPPFIFGRTQQAIQTPFEPNRNPDVNGGTSPISSVECQSAIEEAYYDAINYVLSFARYCLICAFDGNASTGRWLAFSQNNPSNNSPFDAPRAGAITELSLTTNGNSTVTATIFKNGVSTGVTISTAASNKAQVTGLNITYVAGDLFSVRITSGSANRPSVYLFGKFT